MTTVDDDVLADEVARFYDDPLGFVMWAFEWDRNPELQLVKLPEPYSMAYECDYGPDLWACDLLTHIGNEVRLRGFDRMSAVDPQLVSVASGHGIGKSAITAWLVLWIMATRPYARGTVTANTAVQLSSKTWAEIAKWTSRCIVGHWFEVTTGRGSMVMRHKQHPDAWYCTAQTCREENSESFAGQHAANSTSFYIFDEASAVPAKIYEVAMGGLTDGEPMMFLFGNPTRADGYFYDTHHKDRARWHCVSVDSRTVQITNKKLLAEWVELEGEDSDFVRVRVRGVFPSASFNQFIPRALADAATARKPQQGSMVGLAAIVGVDVARFGNAESTIYTRIGRDATAFPPKAFRQVDTMQLVSRIVDHLNLLRAAGLRPHLFVDGGGVGGGVVDRLRQLGVDVVEVQFGSKADDDRKYKNKRAEMWGRMREWLETGAIPKHEPLVADLAAPLYSFSPSDQIVLESKEHMVERGLQSPDHGDGLALTFAYPVSDIPVNTAAASRTHPAEAREYDPLAT